MEKTALVVGTKFGRYAPEILSKDPGVKKVIVTKRHLDVAEDLASKLSSLEGCTASVVGAKVEDCMDLMNVIKRNTPDLTVICTPPYTHFQYVEKAIQYSDVLCEKPFTDSTGNAEHAEVIPGLRTNGNKLGLELPMYPVGNALWKNQTLQEMLRESNSLRFVWETGGSASCIIDDLLLHPWSLLPPDYSRRELVAVEKKDGVMIYLVLTNPDTGHCVDCDIGLAYKKDAVRGFSIGDCKFEVRKEQGNVNTVVSCNTEMPVVSVENPLKQHLEAMLERRPLADMTIAYESQLFLESVKRLRDQV